MRAALRTGMRSVNGIPQVNEKWKGLAASGSGRGDFLAERRYQVGTLLHATTSPRPGSHLQVAGCGGELAGNSLHQLLPIYCRL